MVRLPATSALSLALLAVAGCHHGGGAAARPTTTASDEPAPWLAGLFTASRALVYDVTYLHDELEDGDAEDEDEDDTGDGDGAEDDADGGEHYVQHEEEGELLCRRTVWRRGRWQIARIACATDDWQSRDLVEATFVTDGHALWRDDQIDVDDLAALAELAARPPDVPAHPTAGEERSPPDEYGHVTARALEAHGLGWCVQDTWEGGDGASDAWCVGPDGLEEATHDLDGAAEYYWHLTLR